MNDLSSKDINSTKDGEGFLKTLWKPHNRVPLLLGVGVLLVVAVISELSGAGGLVVVVGLSLKTVATELGFALFIAAILSAGIDESTRRRFHAEVDSRITEIQKNVFRSTYSRNLPVQFFNEVEELLLRCKFSYSNYHITYTFSRPRFLEETSYPHVMDVRVKHTFSVRNLTAVASEHSIRLQVHELPDLIDAKRSRVLSVILRGYGTLEPEKIEEINNDAVSEGGTRTFQIQTDEIPPSGSIDVEIVAQSTQCQDGFAFCRCPEPTSQLTVAAKFPPEINPSRNYS